MRSQVAKYIVVAILGAIIGAALMSLSRTCETPVVSSEYDSKDSTIARGDEMIASLLEQLEEKDTVYIKVAAREKKERKKINIILRDDFGLATDSTKKEMINEALENINNPL